MDWGEIRTRRDSLEDVFVHLVSGEVDEHGEIATSAAPSQASERRRK